MTPSTVVGRRRIDAHDAFEESKHWTARRNRIPSRHRRRQRISNSGAAGGGAKIPTSKVNPFQISRLSKSDVGLGPMTFVWFFVSKLCDGTRSPRAKNEHNACRSRLFDLFV